MLTRWKRIGLLAIPAVALLTAACTETAKTTSPEPPSSASPAAMAAPAATTALALSPEELERDLRESRLDTSGWRTDFTKRSVRLTEVLSGGPPKDGIPAIDKPAFQSVAEGDEWLKDREPVAVFSRGGEAKAYPLQILIWHEIVNDVVGGKPVSITYCPLCNTAIAFDRQLDGKVLDFGTTGSLRFSDLVMYDRQTESWWQQATGEAIVGEMTGKRLALLPSSVVSWADFKRAHPNGRVLSRETGHPRPYGENPYVGYDSGRPFLYSGPPVDGRLSAMERVVAVDADGQTVAFPFSTLKEHPVVNYTLGGRDIAVFYKRGTASALDRDIIAESRDVGATGVFERTLDGRKLTFRAEGSRILDEETGSAWDLLGGAVEGPLKGKKLTPVVHGNHFWFSWAVFKPRTAVYTPP